MDQKRNFILSLFVFSTAFALIVGAVIGFYAKEALADDSVLFHIPGTTEGTGTFFQITDSSYLNITLDSTQSIKLNLQSIPEMLTMQIEADPSLNPLPSSTTLTLSNLEPNKTYYLYQDNYHNLEQFITDTNGNYTYPQDLTSSHLILIQPRKGTKFIQDNPTGGDCSQIGTWNPTTKTCTLTQNLSETIQIDSDNITLDGNSHTTTGQNTGIGILLYARTGVILKNLTITNFSTGIYLSSSHYNTLTNNIISANTWTGIEIAGYSSFNTLNTNSILTPPNPPVSLAGVYLQSYSHHNTVSNNLFYHPVIYYHNYALLLNSSNNNLITTNNFLNGNQGISLYSSPDNTLHNNTLSGYAGAAVFLYTPYGLGTNKNLIYNNNFLNNSNQAIFHLQSSDTLFNLPLPTGGNYWSNYDTSQEGCSDLNNDKICDSPYILYSYNQDNYPWTIQNGWVAPQNQPPTLSNPNQYKSDSTTQIQESGITQESTFVFKANLNDPDNDQAKLQIELKEKDISFNEQDIIESGFVNSGGEAVITRYGLISAFYHWRGRAIDSQGNVSDWQEFGTAGNVDFIVGRIIKVAVILAEPSDKTFDSSHNKFYFEQIIAPQIKDYYCEVSFGKRIGPLYSPLLSPCDDGLINLDFKVFDNNGAPYKLTQNQYYYSQNFSIATTTIGTDGNDNEIKIKDTDRTMEFAWEAMNKADATDSTINYNDYETVIVVYYGKSQQTPFVSDDEWLSTQMWPVSISLTNSPSEFAKNWITVAENDYLHSWAHEFGHALGKILRDAHLCDLYADTRSFCEYNGAIVEWDVMGAHDIENELLGLKIPHFSSFSKFKLNWLAEDTITYGGLTIESLETMKFGDKVKKYVLPNNSHYLLEARTNNSEYSKWDAGLFKDALVIYKVAPKELTIGNETRTVKFVNVAKDIGTIVPDLPYRDPVNNVLIGVSNWFADSSSFKIDAQVSQLNLTNYVGAILQPKLSLLEKIYEFAISPLRNQSLYNRVDFKNNAHSLEKGNFLFAEAQNSITPVITETDKEVFLLHKANRFIRDKFNIFLVLILFVAFISLVMINKQIKKTQEQERKIKLQKKYKTIIVITSLLMLWLLTRMVFASTQPIISSIPNTPFQISEGLEPLDLDLHAITQDGKHAGVNYQTGEYENQIPQAIASGDLVYDDEWIFVPQGTQVKYYVSSHDIEQFLNENLDIAQQLPTTAETYTLLAMYYDQNSQKFESQPLTNQTIDPGQTIIHQTQGTTDIQVTPGITDNQAPTINHTQLQLEYLLNSSPITFNFSADDGNGVGIKQITAILDGTPITDGQTVNFNQVGEHTIVIEAEDFVGNKKTETIVYNVIYNFGGFLPPIKADGSGVYKLGRTLPIKFQLKDVSNQYISTATTQLFVAKISNGIVGTDEIPLSTSNADTGNIFRYDAVNNEYIYNLSTDTLSVGSWQLKVVLDDGKYYTVVISIK